MHEPIVNRDAEEWVDETQKNDITIKRFKSFLSAGVRRANSAVLKLRIQTNSQLVTKARKYPWKSSTFAFSSS